jgi:hypothetical protein
MTRSVINTLMDRIHVTRVLRGKKDDERSVDNAKSSCRMNSMDATDVQSAEVNNGVALINSPAILD